MKRMIFRLTELAQRTNVLKVYDELARNESLAPAQIRELQWEKIEKLIRHAYQTVPYYRESWKKLGITPADIRHFDDFEEKIPLISKVDIKAHFEKFISENRYPGSYEIHTSGTTGSPAAYYKDPLTHSYGTACRYRGRRWWGVNILDNEFRLWGVTTALSGSFRSKVRDNLKRYKDWLIGIKYWSSFDMQDQYLHKCVQKMNNHHPRIVLGFTSAIVTYATFLRNHGLSFKDSEIKVVTYTAEPFYDNQRALVEEHFHPNLAAEYGSIENGIFAFDCPHKSLHIMDDDIYLESLKTAEENNQFYATNLNNYIFPLIRYCTDDRGRILNNTCSCGLPLRTMKLMQGRTYDRIIRPDGVVIDSLSLDDFVMYPLFNFPECRRMQTIQKQIDKLEILVEASVPIPEKIRQDIEKNVAYLTQNTMNFEIKRVDKISVEKSGKFKFIISEIDRKNWN